MAYDVLYLNSFHFIIHELFSKQLALLDLIEVLFYTTFLRFVNKSIKVSKSLHICKLYQLIYNSLVLHMS